MGELRAWTSTDTCNKNVGKHLKLCMATGDGSSSRLDASYFHANVQKPNESINES